VNGNHLDILVITGASPGLKMWGKQQGEPLNGVRTPSGVQGRARGLGAREPSSPKGESFLVLYVYRYRTRQIIPLLGIWREKFTFHIQLVSYRLNNYIKNETCAQNFTGKLHER